MKVEKIDLLADLEVPARAAKLLARAQQPLLAQATEAVSSVEVPDTTVALLIVGGKFVKLPQPGLHVYWKFQRTLEFELVDRRVQTMEVSGQDILTKDKVSLRINLAALGRSVGSAPLMSNQRFLKPAIESTSPAPNATPPIHSGTRCFCCIFASRPPNLSTLSSRV